MAISLNKQNNELLKDMALKQLEMSSEISCLKNDMGDIKGYLYTNPKTNQKGVIERLNSVEGEQKQYSIDKRIFMGIGGVVVFIIGGLYGLIKWVYKV